MGFTEAHAAIDEQRVVRVARAAGYLHRGCASELVCFAGHEAVERERWVQRRFARWIGKRDTLRRRRQHHRRHAYGALNCFAEKTGHVIALNHRIDRFVIGSRRNRFCGTRFRHG